MENEDSTSALIFFLFSSFYLTQLLPFLNLPGLNYSPLDSPHSWLRLKEEPMGAEELWIYQLLLMAYRTPEKNKELI